MSRYISILAGFLFLALALPASGAPDASRQTAPRPAEVGQPAPDFALPDLTGKTVRLSEFRGKQVVLEWFNPDCPFVKFAHSKGPLRDMATRYAKMGIIWLAINSGAPGKQGHGLERNRAAAREYGMGHPILLDESGQVGRQYGARATPHMYLIDDKGVLRYRGALDNAPMGETSETPVNYVDAALEDLRAGRPVRTSETRAYGCSVKYGS